MGGHRVGGRRESSCINVGRALAFSRWGQITCAHLSLLDGRVGQRDAIFGSSLQGRRFRAFFFSFLFMFGGAVLGTIKV